MGFAYNSAMLNSTRFWVTALCFCLLAGGADAAGRQSAKGKKAEDAAVKKTTQGPKKGKSAKKTGKGQKEEAEHKEPQKPAADGTVQTEEELNELLMQAAERLERSVPFQLAGKLRGKDVSEVVQRLQAVNAMLSFSLRTDASGNRGEILPDYHDGTRMGAVLRGKADEAVLTPAERKVLPEIQARMERVLREAAKAVGGRELTDFEKTVAFHDDLIRHTRYVINAETENGSCAVLQQKGIALCAGYTRMMKLLLDAQGIPNLIVTGESKMPESWKQGGAPALPANGSSPDSMLHTWNLVYLDGAWRHLDVTWDDPLVPEGEEDQLLYLYFGLSDRDLEKDHTWDKARYPKVTTETPLYLTRTGQYFTAFADYWKAAEAAAKRGDKEFEAYLTNYRSATHVEKQYTDYVKAGGKLRLKGVRCQQGESSGMVTVLFL